jgi:hypothetical protein
MRKSKYTRELLLPIVRQALTMAEVLRQLRLRLTGGNYRMISSRIRLLEISTDHFKGSLWAKGETADTNPHIKRMQEKHTYPNEIVFIEKSPLVGGQKLTKRLIALGWKYMCAQCGINEWNGKPLPLHLDHINGIRTDTLFKNLRFLCPNCHQQTETWGNKRNDGGRRGTRTPNPVREPRPKRGVSTNFTIRPHAS